MQPRSVSSGRPQPPCLFHPADSDTDSLCDRVAPRLDRIHADRADNGNPTGSNRIFPSGYCSAAGQRNLDRGAVRVMLSPNNSAGWVHSPTDVTHDGITELWHTRLGVQDANGVHETGFDSLRHRSRRLVTRLQDRKFPLFPLVMHEPADPFRMSLDENDRDQIVRLSSDYSLATYPYSPPAAHGRPLDAVFPGRLDGPSWVSGRK